MDALDLILLEAWNRVGARARRDRLHALKKSQRRFRKVLTRPMREWCLVVRASDTRIADLAADIEPEEAFEENRRHSITLTGKAIRELTRPVMIDWPGVTIAEAGRMLGRSRVLMDKWI